MCLVVPYQKKKRYGKPRTPAVITHSHHPLATEAELTKRQCHARRQERRERDRELNEEKEERRIELIKDIEWVESLRNTFAPAKMVGECKREKVKEVDHDFEKLAAGHEQLSEEIAGVKRQIQGWTRQKELNYAKKDGIAIGREAQKAQHAQEAQEFIVWAKVDIDARLREIEKERIQLERREERERKDGRERRDESRRMGERERMEESERERRAERQWNRNMMLDPARIAFLAPGAGGRQVVWSPYIPSIPPS